MRAAHAIAGLCAGLALLAPAAGAAAAGAAGAAPPPAGGAADPGMAKVQAWADRALDLKGWRIVGYGNRGVVLLPAGFEPAGPSFSIDVRYEAMAAGPAPDGRPFRSMRSTKAVDCRQGASRDGRVLIYAGNDLQQLLDDRDIAGDWRPLDEKVPVERALIELCARAPAVGEGPATMAEPDVRAWTSRTVQAGADAYAYYDDHGVYYVQGAFARGKGQAFGVTMRIEMFEPDLGMRSATMRLDMDCADRRYRMSDIREHAGHNLAGEAVREDDSDWTGPTSGFDALQLDRLCAMAGAAPGAGR